jgi:hypothetical protein
MGAADELAENTPNATRFICTNFWDFDTKNFIGRP